MDRPVVFIFGISSFLGSNLAEVLKRDFRVIGTYYKSKTTIEGVQTFPCNILEQDKITILMSMFKPMFTIYCIGLSSLEQCHFHPKLADALNTRGLANVAEVSERFKSRIIYFSSAFVSAGVEAEFKENNTPDPTTVYGKSKVGAEFYIQKSCLNYLIFRTCTVYGRSINPRQFTFFEMLEKKIGADKLFGLDNNIKTGMLDVVYLASLIKLCIQNNVSNRLIQVSTSDMMTKYEFGKLYGEVFRRNSNLISKDNWPFLEVEENSKEVDALVFSLNLDNSRNVLMVDFPTIEESLHFTFVRLGGNEKFKHVQKSTDVINII